jgi:hypothetical protein
MYREFYKPEEIIQTDFSPVAQGLSNFFRGVASDYNKRRATADQYKYALDYSKFENDNKFNEAYVKSVTKLARENFRKSSSPSQQLVEMEEQGKRYAADQKAQHELFTNLNTRIDKKATDDKYYDPEVDKKTLQTAAFGDDGDIDFRTRGGRLLDVANTIGDNPLAFKRKNYVSDWVKLYGDKEAERKYGNTNVDSTKYGSSPFWDEKTGAPGVTDTHVKDYLNSRDDVQNSIAFDVKNEISDEADQVKKLIAQGDERVQKLKGLNDGQLMLHLISNEKDNVINNKPYNERIREKAKKELEEAAKITLKTDVNYKEPKSVNNVNTDQRHEFTTFDNDVGDQKFVSPGGTLMQKNGKPLSFEVDGKVSYDLRSGQKSRRAGEAPFNVTGYQLMAKRQNGTPVFNIDNLSDEDVAGMNPDLQVVFRGHSIDKNTVMGDINRKKGSLETQLGEAVESGDQETINKIQRQLALVQNAQQAVSNDDSSDEEIMSSVRNSNIKTSGIRYDELLEPSEADYGRLKGATKAGDGSGGLDLRNKKNWSPEMLEFEKKYQDRVTQSTKNIAKRLPVEERGVSIKSTGADIDQWTTDNQYKVGNNIYFYDSTSGKWQKR